MPTPDSLPAPADNTFTADYPSLFGDRSVDLCQPDALESSLGPIAYAQALHDYARTLEKDHGDPPYSPLERRRPDIAGLSLDEPALKRQVPRLALVIELLEALVKRTDITERKVDDIVASARYPAGLPFERPWDLVMQVLRYKHVQRWDALRQADRDFPAFAHGEQTSASMRDTLALCIRLSPGQREALTCEPSGTLDDALRARLGLTSDVTLDDLADTATFMKVTGLDRKRMRQLFAVNGVAGEDESEAVTSVTVSRAGAPDTRPDSAAFGAHFVNGGSRPVLRLVRATRDGNTTTRIDGLTADRLDRIERMLRLAPVLGLSFAATDRLLQAIFAAQGRPSNGSIDMHVVRMAASRRRCGCRYRSTNVARVPYTLGRRTAMTDFGYAVVKFMNPRGCV